MTRRQVMAKGLIGRFFGFGLAPALAALSPLMMLPAISYTHGSAAWGAVALGQSIGGGGAVLVELGWALTGPQAVAASTPLVQRELYETAIRTKALVILPVGVICAGIAIMLAPAYKAECAAMAVTTAAYGLTMAWYFIGTGSPRGVLLIDVVPKVVGTAFGSLGLVLGCSLFVLPICLLVGVVGGPLVGLVVIRRNRQSPRGASRAVLSSLRSQAKAVTARGFSAIYIALPVTLVAISTPSLVPTFAAIERLLRLALLALQAVPNVLQAWLGSASDIATQQARIRRAIVWNILMGVLVGAAFALAAPSLGTILFGKTIHFDTLSCALAGLIVFLTCISRATGSLGLVAIRRVDVIAWSAATAAVLGLVLIPTLAFLWGVPGAFLGGVSAEAVNLAIQYVVLRRSVPGLV